jgi:hypothetical protein
VEIARLVKVLDEFPVGGQCPECSEVVGRLPLTSGGPLAFCQWEVPVDVGFRPN